MKTVNVLPVLPEGRKWAQGSDGKWSPLSPGLVADFALLERHFAVPRRYNIGTPPAGAVVWDLQSLAWAIYQPWQPGDPVVVRIGANLHDGVFSRYDFELDDPDVKARRVVVRTWRGEDAYPLTDVFPNRDAAWAARMADGLEVSNAE